jgi:hypothetical protein
MIPYEARPFSGKKQSQFHLFVKVPMRAFSRDRQGLALVDHTLDLAQVVLPSQNPK